ncbi:MAG TPA: hypothetical protein VK111_10310 [Virgibacillus sp.]|nr:hypothetical protein [Virgibacillus sp.]
MQKKMNRKQKLYHFVRFPVLTFCALYIIKYVSGFFFEDVSVKWWEVLSTAIGISMVYWIDLFYPSKPPKDHDEPETNLKEDVKKYTVDGSPFNRLMVIIYSLIILMAIGAYVLYLMRA